VLLVIPEDRGTSNRGRKRLSTTKNSPLRRSIIRRERRRSSKRETFLNWHDPQHKSLIELSKILTINRQLDINS